MRRNVFEAAREAGVILQGLELRLGEGASSLTWGRTQRAGDPEVGEELGGALAARRGMQGEHLRARCRVETGFLISVASERGVLPIGNHPAHDSAAEAAGAADIERRRTSSVWAPERVMSQDQVLVGARGHHRAWCSRELRCIAPLSSTGWFAARIRYIVRRAHRYWPSSKASRRPRPVTDRRSAGWCSSIEDVRAFLDTQMARAGVGGLLMPGSGP